MVSKVVGVQLSSGGPLYSYFNHDETLVETDFVVVELPNTTKLGSPYGVGIVKDTNLITAAKKRATKWIVCKIDTTKYDALKQMMKPEV